ncbi:MAG: peptidoglycan-binding protein [Kiloniellaceae bacterium]
MKRLVLTIAILIGLAAPGWGQSDAGYEAYKRGDYAAAHRIWKPLAEQGDASAQYNLGLLYHHGLGVKRQLGKAAKWYGRAAENGDADAQKAIGDLYVQGFWGKKDYAKAATWYRMAAEQGHVEAKESLRMLEAKGQGRPRQAAPSHAPTEYKKGQAAHKRRDYAEAARRYRKAAEKGHVSAQARLGWLYYSGRGVPQDYVRALLWLNLSISRSRPGKYRNQALKRRTNAEKAMTPAQIAGARRLARAAEDYREAHGRYPDDAVIQAKMQELNLLAGQAPPTDELESAPPDLVKKVQQALKSLGYDPGPADGTLGARTRAAIRAFQADAELAAEGRVSQRLLARLEQAIARTSPPRAPDKNPVTLVRAGRKLSLADARILERKLARDPDALWVRGKLLGFYFYKAKRRLGAGPTIEARRRHVLWLIRNRPEGRLAGSSEATIDPIGHALADEEGYRQAKELWLQQAEKEKDNIKVLLNAARFVQLHDKTIAETLLKRAQAPNRLGYLYALGILGINMLSHTGIPTSYDPAEINGEFASKARAELEETSNIALLVSAASILLQYGTMMKSMLGLELEPDPVDFAEGILIRAQSLSPESQLLGALVPVYQMRWVTASSPEERQAAATATLKLMESSGFTVFGPKGKLSSDIEFAKFAIEADEIDKAEVYASELLAMASADPNASSYGAAIHHGNLVLGRVALRRGNIDSAKEYLIKAGRTPGGGTLSSFGPNMALAKELLEAGEKAAVIEYLRLCKSFWDSGRGRGGKLDRWIKTIKAGGIPEFGPNLIY